jgi:hypothetical protein
VLQGARRSQRGKSEHEDQERAAIAAFQVSHRHDDKHDGREMGRRNRGKSDVAERLRLTTSYLSGESRGFRQHLDGLIMRAGQPTSSSNLAACHLTS